LKGENLSSFSTEGLAQQPRVGIPDARIGRRRRVMVARDRINLGAVKSAAASPRSVEINDRSFFRHPGYAHTLIDALASGEVSLIVARRVCAIAAESEVRKVRKSRFSGGLCLIKLTE
jgi:hypothetical protein